MSADWDTSLWSCAGPVGVRTPKSGQHEDHQGVPAFLRTPSRKSKEVAKRVKPAKWKAAFDGEGRPVGFDRLLKSIALGGVDHAIRPEVWEFLLGCYDLGTTAEYREGLRAVRRQRYQKLIEQCHQMHSSIGTGSLAYTVGSKVMDVRISSKNSSREQAEGMNLDSKAQPRDAAERPFVQKVSEKSGRQKLVTSYNYGSPPSNVSVGSGTLYKCSNQGPENHEILQEKLGSLMSPRENRFEGYPDDGEMDAPTASHSRNHSTGQMDSNCLADSQTGIREIMDGPDEEEMDVPTASHSRGHSIGQMNSNGLVHTHTGLREIMDGSRKHAESSIKMLFSADAGPLSWSAGSMKRIRSRLVRDKRKKMDRRMKLGDSRAGFVEDVALSHDGKHTGQDEGLKGDMAGDMHEPVAALGRNASGERVTEWLWILHKIVVDVVRTDRHLEFYGDAKNMARMSDILAVYAWIDPKTGYCQGMSDLLSPFIVIFEDDADAFWCFESLFKRVRQNFQMEGPVGVMKQLEALSKILEVTDPQMSKHLALIGADNFLFSFRMLLVLFRRELTFEESLFMWEMMWASDFNQAMARALEFRCLEALVLGPSPPSFVPESGRSDAINRVRQSSMSFSSQYGFSPTHDFSGDLTVPNSSTFGANFLGRGPFCGLRPGGLLTTKSRQRMRLVSSILERDGDEELSVFCVAAILVQNRNKLLKEVQSMDDAIKTFNDTKLIFQVHSSIHTAIKLRKKYQTQLAKHFVLDRRLALTY